MISQRRAEKHEARHFRQVAKKTSAKVDDPDNPTWTEDMPGAPAPRLSAPDGKNIHLPPRDETVEEFRLEVLAAAQTRFPDVLSAKVRAAAADTFDFDVTISSTYDTPSRYADGFRVVFKSGAVLGERKLFHDHQDEQPFTRELYSVKVPKGLKTVTIQARDQVSGYGGKSIEVALPGR